MNSVRYAHSGVILPSSAPNLKQQDEVSEQTHAPTPKTCYTIPVSVR